MLSKLVNASALIRIPVAALIIVLNLGLVLVMLTLRAVSRKKPVNELTGRELLDHVRLSTWRPIKTLLRMWLFRDEMETLAERYNARAELIMPVDGSQEFANQLRTTYSRIKDLEREILIFFNRKSGPNHISFYVVDPATTQRIIFMASRADGLTVDELNCRMKRTLQAIAKADVRALEKRGLPPWKLAQMGLAMCGYVEPPTTEQIAVDGMIFERIPVDVVDLVMHFNAWLCSGRKL